MSQTTAKKTNAVPDTAVTIDTELPQLEEHEVGNPYWVGTMPDCPLQNVSAGGVTFPRFTGEHMTSSGDLVPENRLSHGIIAYLNDEQLNTVKEGVRLRVVRITGADNEGGQFEDAEGVPKHKLPPQAHIVMRDSDRGRPGRNYRADRGDVPLARFVYMHRAEKMSVMDTKANWPPHPMERPKE